MKRLAVLTNVIPVMTKADLLSAEEITATKSDILLRLSREEVQIFHFGRPVNRMHQESDAEYPPYAVSSALAPTDDTMDASLLMSPDYSPPFHTSDLSTLVSRIFDPSTASSFRHSAAKKFLSWRHTTTFIPPSLSVNTLHPHLQHANTQASTSSAYTSSSVMTSSLSPSVVLVSTNPNTNAVSSSQDQLQISHHPTYTLSRLADHTQREERIAQVRLARWASDLQRALRNERERFAALQDAERQHWLRARLAESVSGSGDMPALLASSSDYMHMQDKEGALITMRDGNSSAAVRWRRVAMLDPRDPLGLMAWESRVRWKLGRAATLLGGAGLVGAIVVWCVRYVNCFDGDWGLGWLTGHGHGTATSMGHVDGARSWS